MNDSQSQTSRKAIVDHVTSQLQATLGDKVRVFASRIRHLQSEDLPAIGVYALKEKMDHQDTSPRRYERSLTLSVEIVAEADRRLDERLYALADAAELVMLMDENLGGLVEDTELESLKIDLAQSGERIMGCARLEFTVSYDRDLPYADLDNFKLGNVDWDLTLTDGTIDATDNITMPNIS